MDKQMLMQPVDAAELTAVDGGFPDIGGAFADGLKFLKDLVGATTKVI